MRTINNILVPVDVMEDNDFFVEYAKVLAGKLGAKITLLYARPPLDRFYDAYLTDDIVEKLKLESKERAIAELEKIAEKHFQDMDVSIKLRRGQPQDLILEMTDTDEYDMVIMGKHCRKGVERVLFGSVANRVVKYANTPVLTVHPPECKH
ncbi:universal stress protein [Halodesulfovibrio marinisediminis]|uniref:Universal stress protein n=1 Tax=Halodesulfovibrio marinisediminis DSM 17456 TaxID=1121457 RepID=A0A1N6EX90_9BACT|nr:universal stress protein [Halodesulfovibrio marinisediminis]SIN87620.1 Nucleotide-binding universal stress protein, UspA family [Halodesulfovibrio marinisediminis DSM 17456]